MPDSPQNVHLHCASCDAQLGVFENEWVHLTQSYARPKEKGINMGCRIGTRTQVVPHGPQQKEAAGCTMVELFCDACSGVVGQSCKSASGPDQEHLLNLRFFKLSRIYLKNANIDRREEPVFVDAETFDNNSRSASVRSTFAPRPRAPSRNGATPSSFRQSYPPPSQSQPYDPYPPQHTPMLPPRQYPHHAPPQTPSGSPFLHYQQPLMNGYAHPHYPPLHKFDSADIFRPTSADGLSNLQQKVDGQNTSLSDCLNRIAAAETRLANDEKRVSDSERRSLDVMEKLQKSEAPMADLRQRLNRLEKVCQSQNTICNQSHNIMLKQEGIIARQAQQLASVTEKLEALQSSMDQLKTQIEEIRTRPVPESSPQSKKHDFLENMEVMIKAMRGAQSTEREMESLREKNNAVQARLQVILAATGGSVSEEDGALLNDSLPNQDSQDLQVLGKRKRAVRPNQAEQRKMPRRESETSVQDDQALPTPDSLQPRRNSLHVSQASSVPSQDVAASNVQRDSWGNELHSRDQERPVTATVADQHKTTAPNEQATVNPVAVREDNTTNLRHSKGKSAERVTQKELEQRPALPEIHQVHAVTRSPAHTLPPHDNQLAYFPQESASFQHYRMEPVNSPQNPPPWSTSRHQRPGLYSPSVGYARFISGNPMNSPGSNFTFVNSTMLPPSQVMGPLPGNIDPRLARWKRDESIEPRTFSDAVSRGQKLEDVIQRPSRQSSVAPSENVQRRDKQPVIESGGNALSRQYHAPQPQVEVARPTENEIRQDQTRSDAGRSADMTKNAEAVDFSDEENTVRVVVNPTDTQDKQTSSTTPTGEAQTLRIDRASVAREIRELAQAPLQRPVLKNHEEERPRSATKGAASAHPRPVLPGVAAAILNLDASAARHVAASSPQSLENEASRRSQGTETATQVSPNANTEQTNTSTQRQQSVALDLRADRENTSTTAETPQSKCETPSTRPGRGRPRKSQTTAEATSSATSGLDNDDTCAICKRRGRLLCCDGCPRSYHHRCLNPPMDSKQQVEGDWFCPSCNTQRERQNTPSASASRPPPHDDSVMMMRRKLAEEALAKDIAKMKSG